MQQVAENNLSLYENKSLSRRTAGILGIQGVSATEMAEQLGHTTTHCQRITSEDKLLLSLLVNDRLNSFVANEWLISVFTLKELERTLVMSWTQLHPITKKSKPNGNGADVSRSTMAGDSATKAGSTKTIQGPSGVDYGALTSDQATPHIGSDTKPLSNKDVLKQRLDIAASLYALYDRKMRLYDRIGKGMGVARKSSDGNKGSHTHSLIGGKKPESPDYYAGLSEDDQVRDTEDQIKLLSARLKELKAGLKKQKEVVE